MIAEPPSKSITIIDQPIDELVPEVPARPGLSMDRVVSTLQLLLAVRRVARAQATLSHATNE